MPGLKISILQQPLVWMDGPANLRHFDRQLEEITGRDVIVLPEMFTTGFAMEAAKQSMPQDEVVAWMQTKAQETNALIAGSAALQTERGPVNRFLLVEPEGKVHFYDKRHLFRMASRCGRATVTITTWRCMSPTGLRHVRCTGRRCWRRARLRTRRTWWAVTAWEPTATGITTAATAGW